MRNRFWIASVVLVAALQACNLQSNQSEEETPPLPQPTLDPPTSSAPALPTFTPIPSETSSPLELPTISSSTSTPSIPIAWPKEQPVNCRFGPGIAYAVAGGLEVGKQAEIVGRNADQTWWQVKNPNDPSTLCWLSASVTNAAGNLDALPVASPPSVSVIRITVSVDPPAMNVACDALPQVVNVTAEIATNGPTSVNWRWETSAGEFSSEDPLTFLEGGTQVIKDQYQVASANDYWIQVHVLNPNDKTGRVYFKVNCSP